MAAKAKVGGGGAPRVQTDNTPDADAVAGRVKRDRLAEINAGLSRILATLRSGVAVLVGQIEERE